MLTPSRKHGEEGVEDFHPLPVSFTEACPRNPVKRDLVELPEQ